MSEKELFEKVEQYIFETMPKKEAIAFTRAIAKDPELANLVKMHKSEHKIMEILIASYTKKKLKSWKGT